MTEEINSQKEPPKKEICLSIAIDSSGQIKSHIPMDLEKSVMLLKILELNINRMISERFTPPKDKIQLINKIPIINKFMSRGK